jgi:hypothetical protein
MTNPKTIVKNKYELNRRVSVAVLDANNVASRFGDCASFASNLAEVGTRPVSIFIKNQMYRDSLEDDDSLVYRDILLQPVCKKYTCSPTTTRASVAPPPPPFFNHSLLCRS